MIFFTADSASPIGGIHSAVDYFWVPYPVIHKFPIVVKLAVS